MRTIKFRGKTIATSENPSKWVYGYYSFDGATHWITNPENKYIAYIVEPETVGQCTGLQDKNGKKIYEGDMIKCHSGWWNGWISWQDEGSIGWCIEPTEENKHRGRYGLNSNYELEAIGNITDNPDLIKGK